MKKINLLDNIVSSQDLQAAILEVRRYAKWFAQTEVKMRFSGGDVPESLAISQPATTIINTWTKDNPASQKSLDELIATLENFEATAPRISITLAAPPPNSLKQVLTAWCRENINPNILVDYQFNSTMLGGMVVRYGSHIFDWSFRRQILVARGHFAEVLRRV